jgi:hypothetical protein
MLMAGDSTTSWTYAGSNRFSNNSPANRFYVVEGLPEERVDVSFTQVFGANTGITASVGIGLNGSTTESGQTAENALGVLSGSFPATYCSTPSIGVTSFNCVESSSGGTSSFFGGSSSMLLRGVYRG